MDMGGHPHDEVSGFRASGRDLSGAERLDSPATINPAGVFMSSSKVAGGELPSIIHINTERTWRGGESQIHYLMKGLRSAGHRVCVAALPGSILAERSGKAGFDVFPVKMAGDLDLGAASRIARYAKQEKYDILHCHTGRAHAIGILARAFGAPQKLVVSRRVDFPIARNFFSRLKYQTKLVDLYLAVATAIREILIASGVPESKVRVVNSSIDLSRFNAARESRLGGDKPDRERLGLPAAGRLIGNVAALAGHKSQQDLIAAMPVVLKEIPDIHLVLVGEGNQRSSLEAQVAGLSLGENVHFLGFRKDIPELLATFDLFVMSSHMEGFCNSVLEAFAVELPVVATQAGGLPEMVLHEETGLLSPIHDPPALARAMLRLLNDTDAGRKFGAAGRKLVEAEFTVDRMVERTRDAYDTLMPR
jgi:glycosyltransferase involved in cell wall biosynthesis